MVECSTWPPGSNVSRPSSRRRYSQGRPGHPDGCRRRGSRTPAHRRSRGPREWGPRGAGGGLRGDRPGRSGSGRTPARGRSDRGTGRRRAQETRSTRPGRAPRRGREPAVCHRSAPCGGNLQPPQHQQSGVGFCFRVIGRTREAAQRLPGTIPADVTAAAPRDRRVRRPPRPGSFARPRRWQRSPPRSPWCPDRACRRVGAGSTRGPSAPARPSRGTRAPSDRRARGHR